MSKLVLTGVSKKFKKNEVLKGIDACFETGHCVGVLGGNGAGKTTLFKLIMQMISLDAGEITLDGQSLNRDSLMEKIFCGGVNFTYPGDFTVKTIVDVSKSVRPGFNKEKALELISAFGIKPKTKFDKLSTGQETLLFDALGLASGAEFIILDEPVLGVDVNARDLFYSELAKAVAEERSCFIISTHLISEIENLLDQVVIINKGQVIEAGDLEEVYKKYAVVSGKAGEVDEAVADVKVIGTENIGLYKRCYVAGDLDYLNMVDNATTEAVALQDLVKYLTGGRDE